MIARHSTSHSHSKANILGSAINQDGRSSGLTAPNGPSQTSLILNVMATSNIASESFAFAALHGTGTPLGDPIEVSALGVALTQPQDSRLRTIATGSVKACYGHTEGAAGVTGAFPFFTSHGRCLGTFIQYIMHGLYRQLNL